MPSWISSFRKRPSSSFPQRKDCQCKSNLRWDDSDWKYMKEKCYDYGTFRVDRARETLRNVMLDYRVIVTGWKNFELDWSKSRLSDSCRDFLYDMSVIGENLGFRLDFKVPDRYDDLDLDEWGNFDILTVDGKVFANVKLYKNGNRHVKFCKEFMKKLNVEMARINGWVHDKGEAARELDIPESELAGLWGGNMKVGIGDGRELLGLPA